LTIKLSFRFTLEVGWKAKVSPADHPVSQYEFDVLIGADGKRNTLEGCFHPKFENEIFVYIGKCSNRFQAERIPRTTSYRNYCQSGEPEERGGGPSGGDLGRGLHFQPEIFPGPQFGDGYRPGEHRLLQGRDALFRHDS